MGKCYTKLNMAAKAAASFRNAIRYEYPDSMSLYYLGRALQADGKYTQAITAYEDFLALRGDDELAKRGNQRMQDGNCRKEKTDDKIRGQKRQNL